MADILLLGSPYVRGKVAAPGKSMYRYRQDAPITIGDTYSGKALRWVEANGLLVAQGEVLTSVSRKMLAASGLDQDCTLTIDGDEYKYRLLRVAPGKGGEPSEWDALQQAYPGVWMFSRNMLGLWGQEGIYFNESGFSSMRSDRPEETIFGWRPVLERIILVSPDMVGKCLWVSTGMGSLQGDLVEMTDYDLVFRKAFATDLPPEHFSILPGDRLVLEKAVVKRVKEVTRNG